MMYNGYNLIKKLKNKNNQMILFEEYLDYMMNRMSGTMYQSFLKILKNGNEGNKEVLESVNKRIS